MGTKERPAVLIVDDDKDIREAGKVFFELLKYHVITASNFDGAVRTVHDDSHNLIVAFIDLNLKQGKSGLELLRYLKETAAHRVVPYVFTGNDSFVLGHEAKKAGAFEVFRKTGQGSDWDELALCVNPEESPVLNLLQNFEQDDLTGLDNYREFKKRAIAHLRAAKHRKHPAVISLLSIDVDHFKLVNDTHGHFVGDAVLIEIGRVLERKIRPTDSLCHKSGDEYLILIPDADKETALAHGEEISAAVRQSSVPKGDGTKVTYSISFGVADIRYDEIKKPEEALQKLLDRADTDEQGLIARRRAARGEVK